MIKLKEWTRIELYVVTGIIILSMLLSLTDQVQPQFNSSFSKTVNGVPIFSFKLISSTFLPILFNHLIICICYLLLCLYVAPEMENETQLASKNIVFVFALIFAAIFIDVINAYWAILLAIKIMYILFTRNEIDTNKDFSYESGLLVSSWMLVASATALLSGHPLFQIYVVLVIPTALLVYLFTIYYLVPKIFHKKWKFSSYLFNMLLITAASTLVLAGILGLGTYHRNHWLGEAGGIIANSTLDVVALKSLMGMGGVEECFVVTLLGNFFTQMIVVVPLSWNVYKNRNASKTEEIKALKTELGKSDASLNFLKSQINPHFLFNALNTIYGTALQEQAERTGEGIQKLGDMMRFMLQENMEDKISIYRDVEYLKNYIDLQKLRTSISSQVGIEVQIDDQLNALQISPMLLIPFVENAFKHGISLQNPSHIKITLQSQGNTLYFDVHNSIHLKADNDPEKLKSGIGLLNVKQRLALLYPNKHELIIRESAKEFFIHLTLQLD